MLQIASRWEPIPGRKPADAAATKMTNGTWLTVGRNGISSTFTATIGASLIVGTVYPNMEEAKAAVYAAWLGISSSISPITKPMISQMSAEKLDERFTLEIVEWKGTICCVYLNDFRIAGGKPWGGGKTIRSWSNISIRELARAVPNLRDHLGLDYLGQPVSKEELEK